MTEAADKLDPGLALQPEPGEALAALAASQTPLVIGVRHHSPACAVAVPALLERFAPTRVLLELPVEFRSWLAWLGHPELVAPVALAGVESDGGGLAFYPFADFSPELAAVRWARAAGVTIEPCDLSVAERGGDLRPDRSGGATTLLPRLLAEVDAADSEAMWDQLVETRGLGRDPEAVRRAALLVGWALRVDAAGAGGVAAIDRRREEFMRAQIAAALAAGERVAAVVGSFHAAALLDPPLLWQPPPARATPGKAGQVVTSLIAYSHELLDSRSGYPAGIRDPGWQHRVWSAVTSGRDPADSAVGCIVEIAAAVRAQGHVASIPDAREAVRVGLDLARLRNLPAPGRRELLEAIECTLAQGEPLGRGRVLARALEQVMVGRRRGRLAPGTPRSGLAPHVEGLLSELRLPGPGSESAEPELLRLDPLRSSLDRRRHVALRRLAACGVPYASLREGSAAGGVETLTRSWTVKWEPATEAMIELAGVRGVTLGQATAGALRADQQRLDAGDRLTARAALTLVETAAECGVGELAAAGLRSLVGWFLDQATLPEILYAVALVERVRRGHVPGLPEDAEAAVAGEIDVFSVPLEVDTGPLVAAAVRALEGLSGSNQLGDARAMLELAQLFEQQPDPLGDARLRWAIAEIARAGSPLMQGAAGALRVTLGEIGEAEFGTTLGSWVDAAANPEGAQALAARLRGALCVAAPLFEVVPDFCTELLGRIEALSGEEFLRRLPALRDGFEVLSPAARGRLLEVLGERLGEGDPRGGGLDVTLDDDPELLARFARADQVGRAAVEAVWPET